jgi:hypothetical protein
MTGDVTGVAQSPFARAGAHFGSNKNANAIRRHLIKRDIEPENCKSIELLVYGPVFPYWHSKPRHSDFDRSRNSVAALEKQLWRSVKALGMEMLNGEPNSRAKLDQPLWEQVWSAFSPSFSEKP